MSASLAKVDYGQFSKRLEELHDALVGAGRAGDAATIFEDEARKFCEMVIKVTPPRTRAQGEQAIKSDMYNIFSPVAEDFINEMGSKFGLTGVDTWITEEPSGNKKHLHWSTLDPSGAGMAAWHLENRNSKGRTAVRNLWKTGRATADWFASYVVSQQDFDSYVERIQKGVGLRKAAWGIALVKLQGKLAGWIFKQVAEGSPKGEAKVNLVGDKPSISMRNYSPGILDDQRSVNFALKVRHREISKRLKILLDGYAGDFNNNRRIARKARKTYPETV